MLELWGGIECTVNRVGERFRDQLIETGHHERVSDLDRLAELGLKAVRYPVLWERVAPDAPDRQDWRWSDERLARIGRAGIRPIVGLVHHGSGPRYTSLLDEGFAAGLARHAAAVAARYPWIEDWTPVNEPVTTARFCALYGHWYPHHRDEWSFWSALLTQIDGTRLAMRAVRQVNARARLIQTDDLGRTFATAAMADQAAFDNTRRWMGWDLLCGRVVPGHAMWRRLCDFGFEDRLRSIADDPCPPDVIGINHYLTSDRFLDHRVERYPVVAQPAAAPRYVDVEAIRVLEPGAGGLEAVLREAWARYGIPLAVTELHNGCTRDEQLRWMAEGWQVACSLREEGVDVRAVTSWALFGSSSWDTLLTGSGRYEAGAFDVSEGASCATALAPLLQSLARTGAAPPIPALEGEGWWRRPIRLLHPAVRHPSRIGDAARRRPGPARGTRPLLILARDRPLGQALAGACRHRDLFHLLFEQGEGSAFALAAVERLLDRHRPWMVVDLSGPGGASSAMEAAGADPVAFACANRALSHARLFAEPQRQAAEPCRFSLHLAGDTAGVDFHSGDASPGGVAAICNAVLDHLLDHHALACPPGEGWAPPGRHSAHR